MEISLTPELRASGARHRQALAPDPITVEWLLAEAETAERVLRIQFDDGALLEEWENELAGLTGRDITSALRRWAALKHFWRVHNEQLAPALESGSVDAEVAARQIMRREPVVVWLGRHRVEVTSRSYSATAEIAVHELTCRSLAEDMQLIAALTSTVRQKLGSVPVYRIAERNRLRRRLRKLTSLYQRAYTEHELHRMALYAHALTPHGAPAEDIAAEVPVWWRELRPEDDAALLAALFEAGPIRYRALGAARTKGRARFVQDFGFASLFSAWEKELGLKPGELYDHDLAQSLLSMRAGSVDLSEDRRAGD